MICFCSTLTCLTAVDMELCKKIRETSEIPILFLTANDTEQDMLEGFGVGCDDYIPKPFSIEVLRKKYKLS
ncbi:MAG: response regulator transcription factor [Ruminococcus sp.]